MILYIFLPLFFIFRIFLYMSIFMNFYYKFVFRKAKIRSFILNTVLSMHNFAFKLNLQYAFNILFIKIMLAGSNLNFSLNSKNCFDATLRLFLSTKSFRTNTLHGWNFASGITYCLFFCFLDHIYQKSLPNFCNLILFLGLFYLPKSIFP